MKALEKELRRIVEKRLEEGWCVLPTADATGSYYGEAKCCLMGAVIVGTEQQCSVGYRQKAGQKLDVADRVLEAIEVGFMDYDSMFEQYSADLIDIGVRIRRDYCEFQ
jgi:hypothetical protein